MIVFTTFITLNHLNLIRLIELSLLCTVVNHSLPALRSGVWNKAFDELTKQSRSSILQCRFQKVLFGPFTTSQSVSQGSSFKDGEAVLHRFITFSGLETLRANAVNEPSQQQNNIGFFLSIRDDTLRILATGDPRSVVDNKLERNIIKFS